jgi:hypothetical protein
VEILTVGDERTAALRSVWLVFREPQLSEPPDTDPYVRWCARDVGEGFLSYSVADFPKKNPGSLGQDFSVTRSDPGSFRAIRTIRVKTTESSRPSGQPRLENSKIPFPKQFSENDGIVPSERPAKIREL